MPNPSGGRGVDDHLDADSRSGQPYRTLEIRGDVEITPDEDYRFARHVGRKYGGTDFRYADRPGQSRVGVVLRPVRINVTDLRTPSAL